MMVDYTCLLTESAFHYVVTLHQQIIVELNNLQQWKQQSTE